MKEANEIITINHIINILYFNTIGVYVGVARDKKVEKWNSAMSSFNELV